MKKHSPSLERGIYINWKKLDGKVSSKGLEGQRLIAMSYLGLIIGISPEGTLAIQYLIDMKEQISIDIGLNLANFGTGKELMQPQN